MRADEARVAQIREDGAEDQAGGVRGRPPGHLHSEVGELDQIRRDGQPAQGLTAAARGDEAGGSADNAVEEEGAGDLAGGEGFGGEGGAIRAGAAEDRPQVRPRPRRGHGRGEDGEEVEGDDVNVQAVQDEPAAEDRGAIGHRTGTVSSCLPSLLRLIVHRR